MEADYQIATFRDQSGLEAVMTTNKLYIKSRHSSEVFALRAIVGSGVYDDILHYREQLKKWEREKNRQRLLFVIAAILLLIAILDFVGDKNYFLIFLLSSILTFVFARKADPGLKPTLFSYFNLMTLGGTRKFKFDKSDETSASIADFNSKLEETFTSYRP
jgi:hypothetical protein